MRKTAAIEGRPPRRFQLSAVRVDLKKLFIKLGEAAVHGAQAVAGQGESVGKLLITALGAVEAFSIDTPTEVRAWQLVHRAMTRALGALTEEIVEAGRIYAGDMERLQVAADIKIDQQDVRLTNDFFSRPQSLRV